MTRHSRVYLDQAATSWPKLPAAIEAAEAFVRDCGAAAGRGAYRSAQQADKWIADARLWLSRLIHAPRAESIALCGSGTHALNAALVGLLGPGQHVVTTAIEHNSVLRPLHHLRQTLGLRLSTLPCDSVGRVDPGDAESLIREGATALVIGHASNVTGAAQDLAAFGRLAREHGALLIVDASQTVGYLPIDAEELGIDALAAAGHKGLRALAGTGFLYVRRELAKDFKPLLFGGTGASSERVDAEPVWPTSVEVGNLNLPGIVSMAVAAEQYCRDGGQTWSTAWQPRLNQLLYGLRELSGIRAMGADVDMARIPVVSLLPEGWDIHDFAAVLDANFSVEARSGMHCAALVHQYIGAQTAGGTVRFSLVHDCPAEHVEYSLDCLRQMTSCASEIAT